MTDPKQKREIVQSEARDKTAKMIAGLVPMGSAAYELLTTLVVPLHEKKKREFINDLAIRLKKLEEKGQLDVEKLAKNEEFNIIITKAILLAQQNHQKEKLNSLKSIVINSAIDIKSGALDYERQNMFLKIIERIDETQFIMLRLFYKPNLYLDEAGKPELKNSTDRVSRLFLKVFPELEKQEDLLSQMWRELYTFGLVSSEVFNGQFTVNQSSNKSNMVTSFGEGFLKMIESN